MDEAKAILNVLAIVLTAAFSIMLIGAAAGLAWRLMQMAAG